MPDHAGSPERSPRSTFPVVGNECTLILRHPCVPSLVCAVLLIWASFSGRRNTDCIISEILSQEGVRSHKKRFVFPENALNSPTVFSRSSLCVHFMLNQPRPQITQARSHSEEFTCESFWTIFWQEVERSNSGAISHTRRVGAPWLTSLSARSASTSSAAVRGVTAVNQIPAGCCDQGTLTYEG